MDNELMIKEDTYFSFGTETQTDIEAVRAYITSGDCDENMKDAYFHIIKILFKTKADSFEKDER